MTPQNLYEGMLKTVVGQDEYLKALSVTLWLHDQRIKVMEKICTYQASLSKQNLLVIGGSGTGKTLSLGVAAKYLNYDLFIADTSSYTGEGWKGGNIDDIFEGLFRQCDDDMSRAEKAIVFLDEFDKSILAAGAERSFGIENRLLKILEGTNILISKGEYSRKEYLNTTNILFVCAGAFDGLSQIVEKRIYGGKQIGFACETFEDEQRRLELMSQTEKADLHEYGMSWQILGRFSSIAILQQLTEETMAEIILHSQSSVVTKYHTMLFSSMGVKVVIDEAGAQSVARLSIKLQVGARGMNEIIQSLLQKYLFLLNGSGEDADTLLLTADNGEPVIRILNSTTVKQDVKKYCARKDHIIPLYRDSSIEKYMCVLVDYCHCFNNQFGGETRKKLICLFSCFLKYIKHECPNTDFTLAGLHKIVTTYITDASAVDQWFLRLKRKDEQGPAYVLDYLNLKESHIPLRALKIMQHALKEYMQYPQRCPIIKSFDSDNL